MQEQYQIDQHGQKVRQIGEGYWEIEGENWFTRKPETITPQFRQVYKALKDAAEKMGSNNYRQQKAAFDSKYRNRKRKPKFTFIVTGAQQLVVDSLESMCRDLITPEQAMAVLHNYNVMQERFPKEGK